jgi:hypothetical protein
MPRRGNIEHRIRRRPEAMAGQAPNPPPLGSYGGTSIEHRMSEKGADGQTWSRLVKASQTKDFFKAGFNPALAWHRLADRAGETPALLLPDGQTGSERVRVGLTEKAFNPEP